MKSTEKSTGNTVSRKIRHRMVCLAAVLLLGSSITAFAAEGTVKPGSAKIRSSADTASEAVASVKQNDKLEIVSKTTGADGNIWYQIQDGNVKGYMRSDLLEVTGDVKSESSGAETKGTVTETPANVTDTDVSSGKIGSSSVNVRKGPSKTDASVANAKAGTVVSVTGETTGADGKKWYQVSFLYNNSNVTGFIRSDLIDTSAGAAEGDTPTGDAPATDTGSDKDAEVPEGTEPETETAAEQQPETQQPETEDYTQISNVISMRKLPAGMKLEEAELSTDTVKGWESENYYILVTTDKSGNKQEYYLYSAGDQATQQIDNPLVYTGEDEAASGEVSLAVKIALIVLAAVVIILIIVVTVLALRLRDAEWDDDEEDDEDEDDEDEDDGRVNSRAWKPRNFLHSQDDEDDEDEEEEEERPVRRRPQQGQGQRSPQQRPQGEGQRSPQQRPQGQGQRPPQQRPQGTGQRPAQRPRPEEEPRRRPVQGEGRPAPKQPVKRAAEQPRPTKPSTGKPSQKYYDEDDEFEFEFLNMDGKNDID